MVSSREREAALTALLLDAPTIGPRRALELLRTHGDAATAIEVLTKSPTTTPKLREYLIWQQVAEYDALIERTITLGGQFKLWFEPDYPSNLARWDGRPPVLYYKGDLTAISAKALALVGRVDPTEEGIAAATRFARKCVEHEISVVSGLAKGIDGASHRAALQPPSGETFAVVGHGLDFMYPRENESLFQAIPERGAVISQFRLGLGPQRWTFPARNEVMCTLALGTVIVEGKTGCGSIIQADFSFKHERPVFLLRRNLSQPDNEWAQDLVNRGAHVIERFEQVLEVVEATGEIWRRNDLKPDALFSEEVLISQPTESPRRAALFDLDGVIIDSRDATRAAIASLASHHTGAYVAPESVSPLGAPHKELARLGVQHAYEVYKSAYSNAFLDAANRVSSFPAVVTALQELKSANVVLGAVTAQPRSRVEAMMPREIRDLFDVFLTYNETRGDKSKGITSALHKLGVQPSDALFVGDQATDLEAARKASVRGVAVLWGFSDEQALVKWHPDLIIADQNHLAVSLLQMLPEKPRHYRTTT